jgi:4-amino-4-deoxy-L-arabinose transferase-like glycosyltransferase
LWMTALIVTAVALAALGSALSIRTQPGTWPPLLWLASFLLPIPAMITIDHARGTSFRNPFRARWEWAALLLIVGFDLILVGHDMTHWRWAGTPDETDFFGVAKSIVVGTSQRAVLSEGGVFNFQPVLSSYYQAAFMKVFGVNIFAWKLSSAVALAGSLPLIYLFTRELWSRRTAVMAMLFFGSAQLAVGFSHFGYNNVQVYLIIGGALGVAAWARTRQSLLGYYLAGCIAGLGFYTYYTARVVAPLLFLLTWSCDGFPLARKARAQTLALAFGLGLTILPVFSDLSTLLHNMQQLAPTSDQMTTPAATASRILEHWFLSIVHGLWYPGPHHFQSNPIEDPITSTFAVIGFWLCIGGWRHRANGRFLAPAYVLSALLVGATSPHFRPPLTRLLFLSPLAAILAAAGADQLLRVLDGDARTRQNETRVVAGGLVVVSMVWNIATIEYNVRYQHHGYGVGTTSELLRMTQQLPEQSRIIFVQPSDAQDVLVGPVMEEYGIHERFDYRRGVDTPTVALLRSVTPPFGVFTDIADPQQNATLEAVMAQRFPTGVWRASDPGKPWNLRYFDMSGAAAGPSS